MATMRLFYRDTGRMHTPATRFFFAYRPRGSAGIALLLVVGILTMLALTGVALAAMAGQLRAGSALQLDRTAARLLARAGIEYASARLFQDTRTPTAPTADNQPDDWTFRDEPAMPLEKARNPSYAQTEPYLDLNANGRYDEGLDTLPPATDRDKNSRLDAWSGRLRGRYGTADQRFALQISADSARVDVNGGALDLADINENHVPDAWDLGVEYRYFDPLHPYHFDEIAHRNMRWADLIDRLALAVGAPGDSGERLIRGRPAGGYSSLEEAGRRVSFKDWPLLRPYLRIGAGEDRVRAGNALLPTSPTSDSSLRYARWVAEDSRTPVALERALRPVLQALFHDLLCYDYVEAMDLGEKEAAFDAGGGETIRTSRKEIAVATKFTFLTREDAAKVAEFLALRGFFASRLELYRALNDAKGTLFPDAPAPKNDLKLDLVAAAADPDDLGTWATHWQVPPFSWSSYDLDRGVGPYGYGSCATSLDNLACFPKNTLRRRRLPKMAIWTHRRGFRAGTSPAGDPLHCYEGFGSVETTLLQPACFAIESLGRTLSIAVRLRATFLPLAYLSVRTQEEFENLADPTPVAAGISKRTKPTPDRITSYPRFSLESCPDLDGQMFPLPDYPLPETPGYRYSPFTGDLRLMHRAEPAPEGAVFHAPCWEEGQPLRERAEASAAADNFRDVAGGVSCVVDPRLLLEHHGTQPTGVLAHANLVPTVPGTIPSGLYPSSTAISNVSYAWDDRLPMSDSDGTLRRGAIEDWMAPSHPGPDLNLNSDASDTSIFFRLGTQQLDVISWEQRANDGSPRFVTVVPLATPVPDWHHVVVVLDAPIVTIHVNGIPMTFTGMEEVAANPANRYRMRSFGWLGPITLYRDPLAAQQVLQRALRGRYWVPDPLDSRLASSPCFTSPLYIFDRPAAVCGMRWDGFVPKTIEQATDEWNRQNSGQRKVSLRVTVIAWATPDGSGPPREHALPEGFWRRGGGWESFELKGVRSLKYRVEMDASAVDGFNNETPVLDSISIGYRTGGRLANFVEE